MKQEDGGWLLGLSYLAIAVIVGLVGWAIFDLVVRWVQISQWVVPQNTPPVR